MRRGEQSIDIAASCQAVFDIVHDYSQRLAWDSMLSEARLLDGAKAAATGVRSRCVGTWKGGFIPMETEYIRFERGEVAAVKLTNRPAFFQRFAATIRHAATPDGGCRTTYIYSFEARPLVLARVLEPFMNILLRREVQRRLERLRDYVERGKGNRYDSL